MFTALLSLTAVAAGAQTMYDGLTFSQNNYYGTARSIGMGNAMTAVGGDLGSILRDRPWRDTPSSRSRRISRSVR